jgi:hypothetical protein
MNRVRARATKVRFLETSEGTLSGLEVEAPPNHPLHWQLGMAVAEVGLQIVQREAKLLDEHRFQRVQLACADGSGVPPGARLALQTRLMSFA